MTGEDAKVHSADLRAIAEESTPFYPLSCLRFPSGFATSRWAVHLACLPTTTSARTLGNFIIPASWFQSINPIVILLFAPLLAWLWEHLQRIGREPGAPLKMTVAYLLHRCRASPLLPGLVSAAKPICWSIHCGLWRQIFSALGESCCFPQWGSPMWRRLRRCAMVPALWPPGFWPKAWGINSPDRWLPIRMSIQAGHFYAIFVAIAIVSMIALLVATPSLNRLSTER